MGKKRRWEKRGGGMGPAAIQRMKMNSGAAAHIANVPAAGVVAEPGAGAGAATAAAAPADEGEVRGTGEPRRHNADGGRGGSNRPPGHHSDDRSDNRRVETAASAPAVAHVPIVGRQRV